jgi:glucan phosphoethanolaminetransferase (alkaline phosphatase superfamily)
MKKSLFQKITLFSFSCLFIYFNIYFFQPRAIELSWLPEKVWQPGAGLVLGTVLFVLISNSRVKEYVLPKSRKLGICLIAVALLFAALAMVYSGAVFTKNRFTVVNLEIRAVSNEGKTNVIRKIMLDSTPVDLIKECQKNENAHFRDNYLVLDSTSPEGVIKCALYPENMGEGTTRQISLYFERPGDGGSIIVEVNNEETRISTSGLEDAPYEDQVIITIPLTQGMVTGKVFEFLDYCIILFVILNAGIHIYGKRGYKIADKDNWESLFVKTYLAVIIYVFMEWLFIVTKPSFLSLKSISEKLEVFVFSSFILCVVCGVILLALFMISKITGLQPYKRVFIKAGLLLPVLILSALVLILIDNFTYTIFSWGIVTSSGLGRAVYALIFVYIFASAYPFVSNLDVRIKQPKFNYWIIPALLAAGLLVVLVIQYRALVQESPELVSSRVDKTKAPNIILITGDGLNANHMSAYGYRVDTTPNIKAMMEDSLVAENNFTNAGCTTGSTVSIYTGKYPMKTGVLYPPDILSELDAIQHFPGILKSMGYFNIEMAYPYQADAYDLNVIGGFDIANGRVMKDEFVLNILTHYLQTNKAYFIFEINNRLFDRLKHIFFITKMVNIQSLVRGYGTKFDDDSKITEVLEVVSQQSTQPVFAHIHWMGTHLDTKYSEAYDASSDTSNDERIKNFDAGVGKLIEGLKAQGVMDNTLLIIGSDHGRMYQTNVRLPLIFHFPGKRYAGRIQSDVQNMDIGPTILDYLSVEKPAWMQGESVLRKDLGNRVIYGTGGGKEVMDDAISARESMKPPFYLYKYISVIYCNYWYRLDFDDNKFSSGEVAEHTAPCSVDERPSDQQAFQWMVDHLKENKFDTSSLSLNP